MHGFKNLLSQLQSGSDNASLMKQYKHLMQAINDVRSGKVNSSNPDQTTLLQYKLDIDERGILKSAKPSQSMISVTAQETMNVRRLSQEAQNRGEDVVSVDIDYKTDIVDGKLAIKAGKTTVVSKPQPEKTEISYSDIGAANKAAADSSKLFNLDDDGAFRGLSSGLVSEEATPETVQDIFEAEYLKAEEKQK